MSKENYYWKDEADLHYKPWESVGLSIILRLDPDYVSEDNKNLIVDALATKDETGLSPSQLLQENKELKQQLTIKTQQCQLLGQKLNKECDVSEALEKQLEEAKTVNRTADFEEGFDNEETMAKVKIWWERLSSEDQLRAKLIARNAVEISSSKTSQQDKNNQ